MKGLAGWLLWVINKGTRRFHRVMGMGRLTLAASSGTSWLEGNRGGGEAIWSAVCCGLLVERFGKGLRWRDAREARAAMGRTAQQVWGTTRGARQQRCDFSLMSSVPV